MPRSLSGKEVRRVVGVVCAVSSVSCDQASGPDHAPSVRITAPLPGTIVLAGDTVVFRALASDSGDAPLPDTSVIWLIDDVPFATGDSTRAPLPTAGLHVITARVIDDGGLTASDRVPIEVRGNSPPIVASASAYPNAIYPADTFTLSANVADFESPIPDEAIRWSSDLDGDVGTGKTLLVLPGRLRPGVHQIAAIVTDPQGLADTFTVTSTISTVPDRVRWSKRFPGFADATLINLADDGTIIFALGRQLFAVRPDGQEKWRYELDTQTNSHSSGLTTSPNGTIFVFTSSGMGHALRPDGTLLWQNRVLGGDPHGRWALGPDRALYAAGTMRGNAFRAAIERISPDDGSVLWEVNGDGRFHSHGAFVDPAGRVVADLNGTGSLLTWVLPTGVVDQAVPGAPMGWSTIHRGAMSADGTMYLSTGADRLVAVAPDGSHPWTASFTDHPSEAVVDGNNVVYVAANGANGVRALRGNDGTVLWQATIPSTYQTEPALTNDGGLLIPSGRTLFALSTADGSTRWSVSLLYDIHSSLVIASDGTIYCVTAEGRLVAIRGDAPIAADAPWSTYRGSNRGTASVQR